MTTGYQIWVVDDDASVRWVIERALTRAGLSVRGFDSGEAFTAALVAEEPGVLISDVRLPGLDGMTLMQELANTHPYLPVIIVTAHSDLDSAVAAYAGGAFEYLPKPFDVDELVEVTRRALDSRGSDQIPAPSTPARKPDLLGESPPMQSVFRAIGRLARSSMTVLVTGESGTGKELAADALHRHGPRAHGPFIALNTAAIPAELLESELFGHERGAFTGANSLRKGRFEQAHGGTLFLDEIGDMPPALQTRLLRVLAEGEFFRVGGHEPVRVDVRIIAATHQDLETHVREGRFREDLYHRLDVVRIHMPALRERGDDLALLADHFLGEAARELDTEIKRLEPEALSLLNEYDWPGNVRELRNFCRRLTAMAPGTTIAAPSLPPPFNSSGGTGRDTEEWLRLLSAWASAEMAAGREGILTRSQKAIEKELILRALEHTAGHRQSAARLLGWGRNTLTRKMKDYDL